MFLFCVIFLGQRNRFKRSPLIIYKDIQIPTWLHSGPDGPECHLTQQLCSRLKELWLNVPIDQSVIIWHHFYTAACRKFPSDIQKIDTQTCAKTLCWIQLAFCVSMTTVVSSFWPHLYASPYLQIIHFTIYKRKENEHLP